jgi:hypothetical protein
VDDATTVNNSATVSVVDNYVVVLRWSAFCHANWAELTDSGVAGVGNSLYWAQTWDGHPEYGSGGNYSPMVDGTQLARVCVLPDAQASDPTPNCSGWF